MSSFSKATASLRSRVRPPQTIVALNLAVTYITILQKTFDKRIKAIELLDGYGVCGTKLFYALTSTVLSLIIGRLIMNRRQAVNIVKEISEQCQLLEGKSIKLLPPKDNDALSNTFQVHIQVSDDPDPILVSCIESIAEKYNIATKQVEGYLILYKPYSNSKR
jgi:hypothetical protein